MSLQLFNYGVNIVAFSKNQQKFGMTCSWAMQVDYDKVCLLLGAQSVTGKNISEKDIIGLSALNSDQQDVAINFGERHSDQVDKFKNINYTTNNSAILINDAKVKAVIEVIEIVRLKGIENDSLIYGKVVEVKQNPKTQFLSLQMFG